MQEQQTAVYTQRRYAAYTDAIVLSLVLFGQVSRYLLEEAERYGVNTLELIEYITDHPDFKTTFQ